MSRVEDPTLDETRTHCPVCTPNGDVGLDAEIETDGDGALCTIHPRDVGDETLVTTWITARDDAFVDLENAR